MIRNSVNFIHFFLKGYNHKFLPKKAQTPKKEEIQKVRGTPVWVYREKFYIDFLSQNFFHDDSDQ